MTNHTIAIFIVLLSYNNISGQEKVDRKFFNQTSPGELPEIFAKDVVSYPFMNHSSVTISKNMDERYWSKWLDNEGREEIVYSRKISDAWTNPKTASFSGVYSDDVPFLSPDNKRLYFISRRPIEKKSNSRKENIWFVERIDSLVWSNPQPLTDIINSNQLHWQFSIANNQNLYFSSDDGIKISKLVSGNYQRPELITITMNKNYNGWHPFIAPDESYIIFASRNLPGSFGKYDLYIGFKGPTGLWCDPINLGEEINESKNDFCPIITPDEKFLFFVKQDDVYNIYWVNTDFLKFINPFVVQ